MKMKEKDVANYISPNRYLIILHLYVSRPCRPLTRQRMALYLISYKTNENEGKGCC